MKSRSIEEYLSKFESKYAIDNGIELREFDQKSVKIILTKLTNKNIAYLLKTGNVDLRKLIMSLIDYDRLVYIFQEMKTDDVVDIIGLLKVDKRKAIFKDIKRSDLSSIEKMLGYKSDVAGGIMTTEYITLNKNMTLEEAYLKVCKIGPKSEVIEDLYVVNDENKLIGKINIRDILVPDRTRLLTSKMNNKVISVTPDIDQEEVAKLVSKYDLVAIPVVNNDGIVLGVITLDDIIDVIYQEQAEDILNIGGVSSSEKVRVKPIPSIAQRLPWLVVNLGTVFFAAFVVSMFESEIERFVALAMAMPIIAGMGGNSGNQVLAMTIRNLMFEESIPPDKIIIKILKEILIGFINGVFLGSSAGVIIYLRYEKITLSIIVGVAMICNFIIANIAGLLVPTILKKLKLDPAVGSSVLLTAITDSFGFFILLTLARTMITYL